MNERSKAILKQTGILVGWIAGTVAILALLMYLTYGNESQLAMSIGSFAPLVALGSIGFAFAYFGMQVRPWFKDETIRNLGCLTGIGGVVIAFLPLIIANATTAPGGNMFSEAEGGGSAIWLMIFSVPAGFFVGLFGLKVFTRNNAKRTEE